MEDWHQKLPSQVCQTCQYYKWLQNAGTIPQTKVFPPQGRRKRRWQTHDTPKEDPHHKQKGGRLAVKALKEASQEAFSKELEVMKAARQAYYKAHQSNFKQDGLYDLSFTFWQMATSTTLLGMRFMRYRRTGVAGKISELPTKLLSPPQKISISLELLHLLSHPK